MGQYWTMKNLDKREVLSTHAFGSGLKYLEQWFAGALYTALMVLLTDISSLGNGGGDFRLSDAPDELKKFIEPVIGSWAGNRIVFSGDYTEIKEYEESDADGNETFTDISDKTALAVWTMIACDTINMVHADKECANNSKKFGIGMAKAVKDHLLTFLKDNVCGYKSWQTDSDVKLLLAAIEKLMPEQTHVPATKRSRTLNQEVVHGGRRLRVQC